jgi:hypothetical protein
VTDPVKTIQTVKQRLARLAAMQTLAALLPPLLLLAAAAIGLRVLGEGSWERWGFEMVGDTARRLQIGLLCAAGLGLIAAAVAAFLSFRRADDQLAAAEQIDRKLGCRQEVLTLATLAGATPAAARSPLFPLLWRRAAAHLERLDPARTFPFQIKPALRRAVVLSAFTIAVLVAGISVLLAAGQPPLAAESRQLRKIARELAASNPGDAQTRELAAHLRAVAKALDNPNVPPETKLEQLASVEQEVKAQQQRRQQQASGKGTAASAMGKGTGTGSQGQGAGEGKGSAGQGKAGTGSGPGKGAGTGTGSGGPNKSGKGEVQLAEARKDISKLQAQLEAEAKQKSGQREANNGRKARAPRPGEQPNLATIQSARNSSNLNPLKPNQEHGQEQSNTRREEPAALQHKDYGSSQGDTHLGQFPRPGNFERFYKAGEHGAPIDVRNARYVLFRIPTAIVSAGGGKSVADNDRPRASVQYANLPLKDERIAAEPDETQLVPPRYRELLR